MTKDLPIFTDEHLGHVFAVDFTQHQNGITIRYQIDAQPWREDHDNLWPNYDIARTVAVGLAKESIDRLVAK